MSKIKNGALDQYGAEPFEQQQFGKAGVEGVKGKGKERKSIYMALFYQASQSAQTWITQFYMQITPCLPFPRKRSPDGATLTEVADI